MIGETKRLLQHYLPITDMQKRSLDHFVCLSSSVGGTMIPTSFHDDVMAGSSKRLARCLHPEASSQNNGVNIFSLISSGIPVPLSPMRISTLSPRFLVVARSSR